MHPMSLSSCYDLSFTLPDKQFVAVEQFKQIISSDPDIVGSQLWSDQVVKFPGSESWQYFSLLLNVLQYNIILQKLLLPPPLMIIEGMTGFAKQFT